MGTAAEYVSRTRIGAYFHSARESRKLVLLIVAIALLLDNMLLTTVVPIIPEFLYIIRHPNDTSMSMSSSTSSWALERTLPPLSTVPPATLADFDGDETGPPWSQTDDDDDDETTTTSARPRLRSGQSAKRRRHDALIKENVEVGIMFASKAVVQLIANPFVGPLTNRIGYSVPMFMGFVIMFFSTIRGVMQGGQGQWAAWSLPPIFAFSRSYFVLFVARALQGLGSSCSSVAGMGMLAQRYPDDRERGNAMGIALGGLALGVLIGPPFGGFMYQFVGKSAPFLILAMLALLDGCLQLLVLQPSVVRSDDDPPTLKALITDPYIIIASGAITFGNIGMGMLEPSLPIFMMDRMDAEKWQLGAAFLPASISYLIGTNMFGPMGHRMGRWLAAMLGLFLVGIALVCVPFAARPNHLILPMAALGFGIGMVDSSMMPELGYLVDIRHSAVYGGVYAIGDIAFCLGFAIGPALSGSLVGSVGFRGMMVGIGIICFLYGPLLYVLKSPPPKSDQERQEATQLVMGADKTTVKYANFDDEFPPDLGYKQQQHQQHQQQSRQLQ